MPQAVDENLDKYSGGGGGHPIGACHVCPLHSPAKRRAASIKKRIFTPTSLTTTATSDDDDGGGKKNENFNFPLKSGPGNETAVKSADEAKGCSSSAGGGGVSDQNE